MHSTLCFWFSILYFLIIEIFSCPIWAGPRRVPHSALYETPKKPEGDPVQIQVDIQGSEEQQWPLAQWAEAGHQDSGAASGRRVRRKDSDLIPLDLEVFRRENVGPKPVWKDPQSHPASKRKHDQADADDE